MVPANGSTLDVETGAGVLNIAPHWSGDRVVGARVDMGEPILRAADVPVDVSKMGPSDYTALDAGLVESLGLRPEELAFDASVEVNGVTFALTAVSMGNPHVTAFIDEPVNDVELDRLGPRMEHHEAYPRRINFHLVNYVARDHLISRTWERGSGLTLACGTGVSSIVVAARLHGIVDDEVRVEVPGGELTITWPGHGPVFMDGDAVEVFSGDFPD